MKFIRIYFILLIFSPLLLPSNPIVTTLSLNDLRYSSQDNELEIDTGLEIENKNQDSFKYTFSLDYLHDNKTNYEGSKEISYDTIVSQKIETPTFNNFFYYTNSIGVEKEKDGNIYIKELDIEIAPIGIKKSLYTGETITNLSIEYMPAWHYLRYDKMNSDYDGYNSVIERSIKHIINIQIDFEFLVPELSIESKFSWQKRRSIGKSFSHKNNTVTEWSNNLNYELTEFLSFGLEYQINRDELRFFQELDKTERITDINFILNF